MNIFANDFGIYLLLAIFPLFIILALYNLSQMKKRKEKWGGALLSHFSAFEKRNFTLFLLQIFYRLIAISISGGILAIWK
ncbi:MAG: hypothetical protein N2445_01455 [Acidobacteria bacterium]|nr:hypothetical protein [Acidobacteriota bacterium]